MLHIRFTNIRTRLYPFLHFFFNITGAIRKMEVSLISLFDFSFLRLFFLTKEKLIYMSCLLLGDFFCV